MRRVIFHSFKMGDVEDPEIYAAQPIWDWQQTEQGQWVMEHAVETPMWHRQADPMSYGYKYLITAKLQGAKLTEWLLRHATV
jgi:hypothetical protein